MNPRNKAKTQRASHGPSNPEASPTPQYSNAPRSELATEPLTQFLRAQGELLEFITSIAELMHHVDESSVKLSKALLKFTNDKEEIARLNRNIEEKGWARKIWKAHEQLIYEMMVCRLTDNYLNYIAELLALIFRSRPETLRSGESASFEEILQHSTMDELVGYLAEKRVLQLSYKGMGDLANYLDQRLDFALFERDDQLAYAVRMIELRNLIVHNRGIVNRIFLKNVPDYHGRLGDRVELESDQILAYIKFLSGAVVDIDARAAEKFNLSRLPLHEQTGDSNPSS